MMKNVYEKPSTDANHVEIHCSRCGNQITCQEELGDFDFKRGAVCMNCFAMHDAPAHDAYQNPQTPCDCGQCGEPKAGVAM